MIEFDSGLFRLCTARTSYWFRVTAFGHLEHIYYGGRLAGDQSPDALAFKRSIMLGSTVAYDKSDPAYSLDVIPLEWSGNGMGDYRFIPAELKMPDGSFSHDFLYVKHRVFDGAYEPEGLPAAYGDAAQTLEIELKDAALDVGLYLYYTVFEDCDVIARSTRLVNRESSPLVIRRLMSMCVDIPNRGFDLVTLDGGWIKEANRHARPVEYGIYVNSSTTGASSNRHNPGFALASRGAGETAGEVYGFNLVYSGNHYGLCELSNCDLVRVCAGINPHCFEWTLEPGGEFCAPQAVTTFSDEGFGGMSRAFHDFVNGHIVRGEWKGRERPVLLNNWEAHFFDFTGGKLTRLARQAKRLGVELFVLDDGWFGKRNSDTAGLGDYSVNRKKLPCGVDGFARRINRMGMKFGLWFEPEMVNEDSDLFRAHPEYAVRTPGRKSALGRNQLVLDLCNPDVRDYIVASMGGVLDSANIEYVKWDMNRHISDAFSACIDAQGEFYHRYILGLYDILRRVFGPRPRILLESCSSGGNRFDLGILCFSPQVWTSDDTDALERLRIQGGMSLFYPQSTFGAHVSMTPNAQTLRETPLSTRFNVAAFGALGYELDLRWLNKTEKREIKRQIAYYKRHRRLLEYGRFMRFDCVKDNKIHWQVAGEGESIAGFFQTLPSASEGYDYLPVRGLEKSAMYRISTKPQFVPIKRFGGLVKHLLPFELDPNGFLLRTANKLWALEDCVEEYEARGDALEFGVRLNNQYMGSGYNKNVRLLGDFGSSLYYIEKID